jgi:hypothetical protein
MLYLRYKNSISDPWTAVPDLTSVFPTQPPGSVPLKNLRMQTAPETETPCGCPGGSATDDHYIVKAEISPMPQSATNALLLFLLRFKQAAYHEAQHPQFAGGGFISVGLSLLDCKNENGKSAIGFRLAAAITDVI